MKKIWKNKRTLRENLQSYLPAATAEFFSAGREALAPGVSWEQMHAFRLQTKRFRYSLETFRDAYGPALERRIESLRKVQTLLGDINDCIVTSSMLENDPAMETVRGSLADRADRKTSSLRRFWKASFDAPGQCEQWQRYLAHYACRSRASKSIKQA